MKSLFENSNEAGRESGWATSTLDTYISEVFQDTHFSYDAVGNITRIVDSSDTDAARTAVYAYDDLYRLTIASTTAASSTPYRHGFAYDAIGNFTGMSTSLVATSTYAYSGTGKANPHAATTINGVTNTYDDNGNLTNDGTRTYTWNYDNTLATLGSSTYSYDHAKQRVTMYDGSATSTYANKYYSVNGATTTRYVYAGDELVTTIVADGVSTSTFYIHPDHLGSTHVVTNASSTEEQALDFYPYGERRINSGSDVSSREYIGEHFDEETDLSYLNARYYDPATGRFLSLDPVFLAVGNQNQIRELTQQRQAQILSDPQLLNSYGYARDNPISNSDPTGLVSQSQIKMLYQALDYISYALYGQAVIDNLNNNVNESVQERSNDRAQLGVDSFVLGTGAVGVYAFGLTGAGAALNAGGIALMGIDKYCAGHSCRNFDPGDRTPQETAKAIITGDSSYLSSQRQLMNNSANIGQTQQVQNLQNTNQMTLIQTQINSIRSQVNGIIQQRSEEQSRSTP